MTSNPAILLVDDDEEFRDLLARRFTRRGMLVFVAGDVDTALEVIECQDVRVAIVDRSLPGGDGLQLVTRLKGSESKASVIILSGHCDRKSIDTALQEGAFEYLAKPCSLADLELAVHRALGVTQNG